MMERLPMKHAMLVRVLVLLIVTVIGLGLALTAFQQRFDGVVVAPSTDKWQWAPAASFDEASPPEGEWRNVVPGETIPSLVYWLSVPIPQGDWKNPQLKLSNVGSLKAVADGRLVHSSRLATERINAALHWTMIPISLPAPERMELLVSYTKPYPVSAQLLVGDKADLLGGMLYSDLDNLVLGALLLFSGLISLGLYGSQFERRDLLYVYFALLAFSGGYAVFVRNHLLQVVWDVPQLAYFHDISLSVATFAFVGLVTQVFPDIHRRANRLILGLLLAYILLTSIVALADPTLYFHYTFLVFGPLFIVVFIDVAWTLWSAYRRNSDLESIWMLAGFLCLAAIGGIHVYRFVLIARMPGWIDDGLTWTHRLPADLLFWGLFAFVVCLIRVIMYRYTAMHRQLTELNRNLEHEVRTRTRLLQERTDQLENAHDSLRTSVRENTEALAEAMRLEERHRITGSIHDTVGHTLSATIVQLEAAKRLIAKDPILVEEKLAASQWLVRRGLEDIRRSVRTLREDASYYDLAGAIGALFRDMEYAYCSRVESNLSALPATLSTLQKRVVFQTLQEGMSLGIRQNRETPCLFLLDVEADATEMRLRFAHVNSDEPPADEVAFGLRTIGERAERIGGRLTVGVEETGFTLRLTLPLDAETETGAV